MLQHHHVMVLGEKGWQASSWDVKDLCHSMLVWLTSFAYTELVSSCVFEQYLF